MRGGKSSELIVAGQLIRHGLDPYVPLVDDRAIDLIVRVPRRTEPLFFEIQIKSVKGYNRIVGLKALRDQSKSYYIIVHYRHDDRPDEFFWVTRDEALSLVIPDTWGDLRFNKPERTRFSERSIATLAETLLSGGWACETRDKALLLSG
jgi:hypothetical protein